MPVSLTEVSLSSPSLAAITSTPVPGHETNGKKTLPASVQPPPRAVGPPEPPSRTVNAPATSPPTRRALATPDAACTRSENRPGASSVRVTVDAGEASADGAAKPRTTRAPQAAAASLGWSVSRTMPTSRPPGCGRFDRLGDALELVTVGRSGRPGGDRPQRRPPLAQAVSRRGRQRINRNSVGRRRIDRSQHGQRVGQPARQGFQRVAALEHQP